MTSEQPGKQGLRQAALRGASWTATVGAAITILQSLQLLVLARFISPAEFGVFAIVMIPIMVAQVFSDTGMSGAIIHKQDISKEHLSSLYWLNVITGIVLFACIFGLTPVVASLSGFSELYYLLPLAGLSLVIAPFGLQFQTQMQKDVDFKRVSLFELAGAVVGSTVSIAGAVIIGGTLALVIGFLANAAMRTALLTAYGWRTRRPMLRFKFSDVKPHLDFALFQLGEKVITTLSARLDQLLVGVVLGVNALGYYNVASNLTTAPLQKLSTIFSRVLFPILARLQNEVVRQAQAFQSIIRGLTFIGTPALLGLAALSQTIVPVVLGDTWLPAVDAIRILSIYALFRILLAATVSLLLANGRADWSFYWTIGWTITEVPAILIGAHYGGLSGAAFGVLTAEIIGVLVNFAILKRLIGLSFLDFMRCVTAPFTAGIAMAVIVYAFDVRVNESHSIVLLAAGVALGAMVYGVLSLLLQRDRIAELLSMVMNRAGGSRVTQQAS